MNKLTIKLVAATFSLVSLTLITGTASFAQDNPPDVLNPPGGLLNNGLAGQPSDFQRPYGGPQDMENGPAPRSPLGNVTPGGGPNQGGFNPQQGGPPQWQGQGQPGAGGERSFEQRRPWGRDGQGFAGQGSPGNGASQGPGQGPGNFGPGGRGQWGGGPEMTQEQREQRKARMMKMFDKNGDGQLDDNERAQMRAYMQQRREQRMQREGQQGGGPSGNQGGGFNGGQSPN